MMTTESKICPSCEKPFRKKKKQSQAKFEKIKYCSRDCWKNSLKAKDAIETKTCLYCEKPFRKPNGKSQAIFESMKYCSHNCVIMVKKANAQPRGTGLKHSDRRALIDECLSNPINRCIASKNMVPQ